ncbi:MAG TPA: type II secretion system protein GspD [Nitrospirae bacterium]|nr:type II secretion system protein GspD [Nitrospirota bacterium]
MKKFLNPKLKSLFLLVFCFLLFQAAPLKAEVGMNFQEVSLQDFVDFVSEYTGSNIIYNARDLKGTITIKAKKEFTKSDILSILQTVLSINNLEAVTEKNIIYIVRRAKVTKLPYSFEGKARPGEISEIKKDKENLLVSVFQIENIDAKLLTKFFNLTKSDYGRIETIPTLNVVVVKDKSVNVRRMAQMIKTITSMGTGIRIEIISLKNTYASEFVKTIKMFFAELGRSSYLRIKPVFMADRTSNSIIVAALPKDMALIKRIISKTDVMTDTGTTPRVFKLKYAMAEDVAKVLNKILSGSRLQNNKLKPPRQSSGRSGMKVAADKATNTISVVGDPELYAQVESLIAKLDVPRDQIFVEALILETTIEDGSKFGVEWLAGAGGKSFVGTGTFLNSKNVIDLQSPVLEGNPPNLGALPGGFGLGILGNIITYEGVKFPTLSALANAIKTESGIDILSKPQLLTLDNEEAEVFVGENRPFLISEKFDANNNPIQTFDYRDVGIKLKILPHVIDDDTVLLNVQQEVKKVVSSAVGVASAPITLTRSTKTTIKLHNNTTVVISGLIKDDMSASDTGVPLLSKIPLLGWLFRSRDTSREKTNMMVFITATIIKNRQDMESLTRTKRRLLKDTGKGAIKKETTKKIEKKGVKEEGVGTEE